MDTKPLKSVEIRDRVDAKVEHVTAQTTVLNALDQKSPEIIEIPSQVMGEIARSIQQTVREIQAMVDSLAAVQPIPRHD